MLKNNFYDSVNLVKKKVFKCQKLLYANSYRLKNEISYLKVSKIIVNKTNFPNNGTTSEVGGIISAKSRKKTVKDSKIEIDKLIYNIDKIHN